MAPDLGSSGPFGVGVDDDRIEQHPQRLFGLALGEEQFTDPAARVVGQGLQAETFVIDVAVGDAREKLSSVQRKRVAMVLQGDREPPGALGVTSGGDVGVETAEIDVDSFVGERQPAVLGPHEPRGARSSVGFDGIEQRVEGDPEVRSGLLVVEVGPQNGGDGGARQRPVEQQLGQQLVDPATSDPFRDGNTVAAPDRELAERVDRQGVGGRFGDAEPSSFVRRRQLRGADGRRVVGSNACVRGCDRGMRQRPGGRSRRGPVRTASRVERGPVAARRIPMAGRSPGPASRSVRSVATARPALTAVWIAGPNAMSSSHSVSGRRARIADSALMYDHAGHGVSGTSSTNAVNRSVAASSPSTARATSASPTDANNRVLRSSRRPSSVASAAVLFAASRLPAAIATVVRTPSSGTCTFGRFRRAYAAGRSATIGQASVGSISPRSHTACAFTGSLTPSASTSSSVTATRSGWPSARNRDVADARAATGSGPSNSSTAASAAATSPRCSASCDVMSARALRAVGSPSSA